MNDVQVRMCVTLPVESELNQRKDGSYYVTGAMDVVCNELIDIANRLHKNISYYITTSTDECIERLKSNRSDMVTSMFVYHEESPLYQVPIPMFLSKITFLTGYNLKEKRETLMDHGTVFTNVNLLETPVYLCSALLILSFILVIWARTLINSSRASRVYSGKKRIPFALREIELAFYGKSKILRLVTFSFAILSFYLLTCFMILYKTSRLIKHQPYVVTNYQQLIKDRTALPVFYDVITEVSSKFKSAKVNTVKGKIWSKLMRAQIDPSSYIHTGHHTNFLGKVVERGFAQMNENRTVLFASTMTMNVVKTMFCGSSPGEQIWRLFVFSDDSEGEELLGYAMSKNASHSYIAYFVPRFRWMFESGIIQKFYKWAMDASNLAYQISGTNKRHQNEQNLACSDHYSDETDIRVKPICVEYFTSFFGLTILLCCIAKAVNAYEISLPDHPSRTQLINSKNWLRVKHSQITKRAKTISS